MVKRAAPEPPQPVEAEPGFLRPVYRTPVAAPAAGAARHDPPVTPSPREVWLSFDDGPHPTHTPVVLDVLARAQIKATFFVVGSNAKAFPKVLQQIARAGHRIGNHSYTHPDLTKLSEAQIRSELQKTQALIARYEGSDPQFRPPYGAHNRVVDAAARALGYRTVLWSVDTLDWSSRYQPKRWITHGIDQIRARNVSTVLMHDIHRTTAEGLVEFINKIRRMGATFPSVDDL